MRIFRLAIMAMLSASWFLVAPLAHAQSDSAAEEKRGLADLEFVLRVLREDYAGFPDKATGPKAEAFAAQVELARDRIRNRPDARVHAVSALLDWFEDSHLFLSSEIVQPEDPYPGDPDEPRPGARSNLEPDFAFKRLSEETVMLRVPDFRLANAERFHALLKEHHETIISTPNLLIDMRLNAGGSDATYEPLMAYLYTRPIYSIGAELRRSTANLVAMQGYVENDQIPQETRDFIASILKRAAATDGDWVGFSENGVQITTYPQVYEYPKRVGILADGAGSSGDQFVIDARSSRKVTLMGGPTAGVIDYSNVNPVPAPSGEFVLGYAMTRSLRLPEEPLDNVGVPPDVPFGDDVTDHIAAAQAWLERQVD